MNIQKEILKLDERIHKCQANKILHKYIKFN